MRIDVYSLGFAVSDLGPKAKECAYRLCRFVGQYEWKRNADGWSEKVLTSVYAGGTKDRQMFVFHRVYFTKFLRILEEHAPDVDINIVHHMFHEPVRCSFPLKDTREPYPYQVEAANMILRDSSLEAFQRGEGTPTVVELEPGEGKTFLLIRAIVALGQRVVLILRPKYVEKWVGDLQSAIEMQPGDVTTVSGGAALMDVMDRAVNNQLHEKVILISNSTYRNYMTEYEAFGEDVKKIGYACNPFEFLPATGAGMLGIDEVHQDFHFNLRLMIYSHVPVLACLSGTLRPDDQFKRAVVDTVFPREYCFAAPPTKPYVRVQALLWHLREPGQVKYTNRGRSDYSQAAFEKWIMKDKGRITRFLDMAVDMVKTDFLPFYRPGKRYLVFNARKEMCTLMADRFKKEFGHLKVFRYIGEDPFWHTEQFELMVSTSKSAGTALDMPGLERIIMFEAINDSQANKQIIKRIRNPIKLGEEGQDFEPCFSYSVCQDVPQHRRYHDRKMELFQGKVLAHHVLNTDYVI